jgi:ectoine hydroxylase-related dioxygenase (phytanoyl-CoA dioxygenase family)
MHGKLKVSNIKKQFEKFGFCIVRKAFSEQECYEYKEKIIDFFSDKNGNLINNLNKNYRDGKEPTRPMAFNDDNFSFLYPIFQNQKLINTFNNLTNNSLMFLHHSDVHVDTVAGKGWHRDCINNSSGRNSVNWKDKFITKNYWDTSIDEKYNVIRAALYLQDHSKNNNGLHIIAGSHLLDNNYKEMYIPTKLGDVILFDARLKHKGGPDVEKGNYRTAIFWAMGEDNIFSHEHKNASIARQLYQRGEEEKDYNLNKNLKTVLNEGRIGF